MADNYLIVGKNGEKRTTGDVGEAALMAPGKDGKTVSMGADASGDWKPWAFTAGGGALAYLLTKFLTSDDDEKKGKKKSWFKSILPYLAAAGGAFGGYALSQPPRGKNGAKGETAFKIDENGKVLLPDDKDLPSDGSAANWAGIGLAGTAGATGLRGVAKHHWNKVVDAERLVDSISANDARTAAESARTAADRALQDAERKVNELGRTLYPGNPEYDKALSDLAEKRNSANRATDAFYEADNALRRASSGLDQRVLEKAIRRAGPADARNAKYMEGLRRLADWRNEVGYSGKRLFNWAGRGGRMGRAGTWASILAPFVGSPLAFWLGSRQSAAHADKINALKAIGAR